LAKFNENKRGACFKLVIVLVSPEGKSIMFKGEINGKITKIPAGRPRSGLEYDTIFIPSGHKKTFAQMNWVQKNKISHRSIALKKLKLFIKSINKGY